MIDSTPSIPGVLPGMTLEQGLSIHPDALVIEANEPYYRGVSIQILTSLQQISDRVEGRRTWGLHMCGWTDWSTCTAAKPVWSALSSTPCRRIWPRE